MHDDRPADEVATLEVRTSLPDETEALGRELARFLEPGSFVALDGPLGAGKTVLVRGIARGMGISVAVTSPTFTIIHLYEPQRLCHIDAFRLTGGDDLLDAGLEEYLDGTWVCALEWADLVADVVPPECLRVSIRMLEGEEERSLLLEGGTRWREVISSLGGAR